MRQTFRREEHIRHRRDFKRAYDQGARLGGRHMTLFVLPTDRPTARLGIAATRKLGGAVARNTAKRLIREIFRRNKPAEAADVVVVPRPHAVETPISGLEEDYRALLKRRRPARGRPGQAR